MDASEPPTAHCAGCGPVVQRGTEGWQSTMDELLALHFTQPSYFGVHRLFVDTYCLQHPERYCAASASSPAEHHRAVEQWSRSTWEAYADLQSIARHWVALAIEPRNARRGAR
jgi:hypothetical protein